MGIRVTKRGTDLPKPEATDAGLPDLADVPGAAELLHLAALEEAQRAFAEPSEMNGVAGYKFQVNMGDVEQNLWPPMATGKNTTPEIMNIRRTLRNYLRHTGNMACLQVTGAAGIWWVSAQYSHEPPETPIPASRPSTQTREADSGDLIVEAIRVADRPLTSDEITTGAAALGYDRSSVAVRYHLRHLTTSGTLTRRLLTERAGIGRYPYAYALPEWGDDKWPAGAEPVVEAETVQPPAHEEAELPAKPAVSPAASQLLTDVLAVMDAPRMHLRDVLIALIKTEPGRYAGWSLIQLGRELREAHVHVLQVWQGSTNRNGITREDVARAAEAPAAPPAKPAAVARREPVPYTPPAVPAGRALPLSTRAAGPTLSQEILDELKAIRKLLESRDTA